MEQVTAMQVSVFHKNDLPLRHGRNVLSRPGTGQSWKCGKQLLLTQQHEGSQVLDRAPESAHMTPQIVSFFGRKKY